ncbi:MAG TPA: hypothetical protein VNT79_08410, partial [Phycisphaerae bacterium]|nr:hypothetical protein [Phycisphaerae bacterium]
LDEQINQLGRLRLPRYLARRIPADGNPNVQYNMSSRWKSSQKSGISNFRGPFQLGRSTL